VQALQAHLATIDREIQNKKQWIVRLTALQKEDEATRAEILTQIEKLGQVAEKDLAPDEIDYFQEFDWSQALKAKMRSIFHIGEYRLCQAG